MSNSGINITVCDECKGEFILTEDNIKTGHAEVNNVKLKLTYFICPHCNKLYRISIDTDKTQQLKDTYLSLVQMIQERAKIGKLPTQSQLDRVNKQKKLLDKEYQRLDSIYSGVFYQK
jgi:uncharacterized protein YbaR (Trm112 family)